MNLGNRKSHFHWRTNRDQQVVWHTPLPHRGSLADIDYSDGTQNGVFPGCFLGNVHESDKERYLELVTKAIARQEPYVVEFRSTVFNSSAEFVRESSLPVFDEEGGFSGYSGVVTPVAEFNHPSPSEVRSSEERLRIILDNLPSLVSYVDTNHFFRYNNKAYETYMGKPLSGIAGKHMKDVLGEDAYNARKEYVERAISGEAVSFEISTPHPDGIRHTSVSYTPDFGEEGVKGIVCLINDITAAKEAEFKIRLSEERYRLALESGGIGIWDLYYKTRKPAVSKRLIDLFEVPAEKFPRSFLTLRQFLPRESRKETTRFIASALKGESKHREFQIRTGGGKLRWVSVIAKEIYDHEEKPVRILFAVNDITSQKEALLLKEKRIKHETEARSVAEYANRMKDEFLATLSHELRTPLHSILGWSQYLQRINPTPEQMKEGLKKIELQVQMQSQLVSDLLDMSGIISGKLSLETKTLDLRTVVEEAIDTVKMAAEGKSLKIAAHLPVHTVNVKGDWKRLLQVIWNILNNSIKFSEAGKTIKVRLYRLRGRAILKISDEGIGMDGEFLPFVFDRFKQADASVSRKVGGLGIGLALCKQLVEMHSGRIKAFSEGLGKGSEFTISLPLQEAEAAETSEYEKGSLKNVHILLVEDDEDSRQFLSSILTECDAEVRSAENASGALSLLEFFTPQVIISDISLPEMDGIELIKRIRSFHRQEVRVVPAIALTALSENAIVERCLAAGFRKHFAKPLEADEMVRAVIQLLNSDERPVAQNSI